jgi:hypothetical protein
VTPHSVQAFLLTDGLVHVHKAGCADIDRQNLRRRASSHGGPAEARDRAQLAIDYYSDMTDTDTSDRAAMLDEFGDQFKFYPCVAGLPDVAGIRASSRSGEAYEAR